MKAFDALYRKLHTIIKFVGVGAINTGLTYLLYLGLMLFVSYQIAYAIAFVAGILIAYVLNTRYVFKVNQSVKKLLLFPLVYLIQYVCGAAMMHVWVAKLSINASVAPLLTTVTLLPLTYALTKIILKDR